MFEEKKWVLKRIKSIDENWQKKKDEMTNNDIQTLHWKLKIEQHEPHYKAGVNWGVLEGWPAVPSPLAALIVLLNPVILWNVALESRHRNHNQYVISIKPYYVECLL